ncbi:uncharacterized protein LOC126744226 [Anthonomus grandis grandis]|uniref:uncharacterized protein LOC126744226 n=1 Tax=Anthonomus grandis grandis TaxID=2921223 RepID=UPI00216537C3|nr:uncharacterized protein LOC126744226 [Anthonomus grandis grandis]
MCSYFRIFCFVAVISALPLVKRKFPIPLSPCPSVFRYERIGNNVSASIFVKKNQSYSNNNLRINMTGEDIVLKKHLIRLRLVPDEKDDQKRTLHFKISFNEMDPVPSIEQIWFNDVLVCNSTLKVPSDGRGINNQLLLNAFPSRRKRRGEDYEDDDGTEEDDRPRMVYLQLGILNIDDRETNYFYPLSKAGYTLVYYYFDE